MVSEMCVAKILCKSQSIADKRKQGWREIDFMSTLNQLWQTVIEGGEGGGILYDVPGLSLFGAQPTLFLSSC